MLRFALILREQLIETTVGFPRKKRIKTMVRFGSISRQNFIETTVRFPR